MMKKGKAVMAVIIILFTAGFLTVLGSVGALEMEFISFSRAILQSLAGALSVGAGAFVYKLYEPLLFRD